MWRAQFDGFELGRRVPVIFIGIIKFDPAQFNITTEATL
jgi:hypothetical protein